jgi:hypothetical protein
MPEKHLKANSQARVWLLAGTISLGFVLLSVAAILVYHWLARSGA